MVVLSAAILNKTKALVARQFVEITRLRIEGLLSAFTKLIEHGGKDHTYIETESVRYVYQPMENLYLLLITNKQSNILEDLETLRLLAQIVQDICQVTVSDELILSHAFDIVFSFDEVISFGYRESVTLSQIKTYTEMESHEEKLQTMIRQSKENEEKERRKQIASRLDKERAKQRREDKERAGVGSSISKFGLGSFGGANRLGGGVTEAAADTGGVIDSLGFEAPTPNTPGIAGDFGGVPKKGMQIGKKKPAVELLDSLRPKINPTFTAATQGTVQEDEYGATPIVNPLLEPVAVVIDERVTASLQAEGGITDLDIQGTFQVSVNDASKADLAAFKISPEDRRFKFKVHPNLNKASQANNLLELKDPSRAFRADTPAPLLKWRLQSKAEELLPLSVSCWPSPTPYGTTMSVELEATDVANRPLQDIHLQFTCPQAFEPEILTTDGGETEMDGVTLHWRIPYLESTCALEFSAKSDSCNLLPFSVEAASVQTVCDLQILECFHQQSKEALNYSLSRMTLYSLTVGA